MIAALAIYVVVACNQYDDCYLITDHGPATKEVCERYARYTQAYIDTPTGRISARGYKRRCVEEWRVDRT